MKDSIINRSPSPAPPVSRLMTVCACLWLGLFPLLQGGTYASITWHKTLAMLALTWVTAVCFAVEAFRGRVRFFFSPAFLCAGGLLVWLVLSCLCSGFPAREWWLGASARMEGLRSQLCYLLIFFCLAFSRVDLSPVRLSAWAGLMVFGAVVLLQRAGLNPLGLYPAPYSFATTPEFQGTIGNVDMDIGYLSLLLGFFLQTLSSGLRIKRPALVLSLSGLAAALFLALTMGVQFGVITVCCLLLLFLLSFLPRRARLVALAVCLVLMLLFCWFYSGDSGALHELHEILHGRPQPSFGSNRLIVWAYSLRLFLTRPWLGGGSGTFETRFQAFLTQNGLTIPSEADGMALPHHFDNPHNEYVALLVNHGLPALLMYLGLLFCLARRSPLPVLGYAIQAFFSFSVCLVAPMFWALLGLSFSFRTETRSQEKTAC